MAKSSKTFTVAEAIEILQAQPSDASVRGFQNVKIVSKPVVVKINAQPAE